MKLARSQILSLVAFLMLQFFLLLTSPSVARLANGQTSSDEDAVLLENWQNDFNGFALICRSSGLKFQSGFRDWQRTAANKSVLICLGVPGIRESQLEKFVEDGGALMIACDDSLALWNFGVRFSDQEWQANYIASQFMGNADCPIVRVTSGNHPVTAGIDMIVTNRPAVLSFSKRRNFDSIATFPKLNSMQRSYSLMAVGQNPNTRLLVCSDESIFTNQMLMAGDNIKLSEQLTQWLREGKRDNLLLLVDGQAVVPENPQMVNVKMPPPSREEILRALQNMPPEKLLQFGNAIATVVEDENLVNELMAESTKGVLPRYFNRFLLFFATFLLAGFLFFRYMASESLLQDAIGVDDPDTEKPYDALKSPYARQRKARSILNSFYARVIGDSFASELQFPAAIELANQIPDRGQIWIEMIRCGNRVQNKRAKYWTISRLDKLTAKVSAWELLRQNEMLLVEYNPVSVEPEPSFSQPPKTTPASS